MNAPPSFFKRNGLSIVMFSIFLACWAGQSVAGHLENNQERASHGESAMRYREYLLSGEMLEATAENWESEFLQMAAFVWLTIFLRQKGSPESKPFAKESVDEEPQVGPDAPGPVSRGGWQLKVYRHSLTLALLGLFLFSFGLHAIGGTKAYNEEQARHRQPGVTVVGYLAQPRFWLESFQNWQSEFMSMGALVVLGIFLRQKGSPESKPVGAPHSQTGG